MRFFLGAGASVSSGVPSAEKCIWEWKRNIFVTSNPGIEGQFSELSLSSVRERIQKWLDQQRIYPSIGNDNEYGFYIEKCYPIPEGPPSVFSGSEYVPSSRMWDIVCCHIWLRVT